MGRSYFLRILLISALLVLCFSLGFARNLMGLKKEESAVLFEEISAKPRQMTEELTDYSDPEPNTNPKNGNLFTPPPPPPPPPPPAPTPTPTPEESG